MAPVVATQPDVGYTAVSIGCRTCLQRSRALRAQTADILKLGLALQATASNALTKIEKPNSFCPKGAWCRVNATSSRRGLGSTW